MIRYTFLGCQNLAPNTKYTLQIKTIKFNKETGDHEIILEPTTLVTWPVFAVMPDKPPEGKFGVGYNNIHNVYRNFNGTVNFSYHYHAS